MARRKFSREFKLSAVKLVNEQGYSVADAAKSLGIDPANVRNWAEKFSGEVGAASGEGAMQGELRRLRKENARLLMEREILKKWRHSLPGSSREIFFYQGASHALARGGDLPGAEGQPQRILRLVEAAGGKTPAAPGGTDREDPCGAPGEPGTLRQPARASGPADRWRKRLPKHGGQTDAAGEDSG